MISGSAVALAVSLLLSAEDGGTASKKEAADRGGEVMVTGSLDKDYLRTVINRNRAQVRHCYEKAVATTPGISGTLKMKFMIRADGSVLAAKPDSSTTKSPELDSCVADAVNTWKFAPPKGGGTVIFTYPFSFNTKGK